MIQIMKNSKSNRASLKILAFLLSFIIIVTTALLLIDLYDKRQGNSPLNSSNSTTEKIVYNNKDYLLKDDIETLLIMGLDKYDGEVVNVGYNNDQQADFLVLLVFDNKNSKCSAIHINRDTMTEINILGLAGEKIDTVTKQLALAHTYGNGREVSCRNTADAVSNLLSGIEIDHYVSLTLDSVAVLNDSVGGVEVEVLDDFTGIDDSLKKGKKTLLKGEQALLYVRTRYGMDDSTNSHRMIRQRQYINALYEKVMKKAENNEEYVVNTSLQLTDYLVSDCSINVLQKKFDKFSAYDFSEIVPFEGEYKQGKEFMEFYINKDSVQKTVIDLFYEPAN